MSELMTAAFSPEITQPVSQEKPKTLPETQSYACAVKSIYVIDTLKGKSFHAFALDAGRPSQPKGRINERVSLFVLTCIQNTVLSFVKYG